MKRIFCLLLVFTLLMTTAAEAETLVAYFSATGNTRPVAEAAAEILGADLYEIVPETPYTEEDLNYNDSSTRATAEQRDGTVRPAIAGDLPDLSAYDTVVIAYPIWWGKAPRIILTFIEACDFAGKTVAVCCTSASSGIGGSLSELQEALPADIAWLGGERFAIGTDADTVRTWLTGIKLAAE